MSFRGMKIETPAWQKRGEGLQAGGPSQRPVNVPLPGQASPWTRRWKVASATLCRYHFWSDCPSPRR